MNIYKILPLLLVFAVGTLWSQTINVSAQVEKSELDRDYAHVMRVVAQQRNGAWRFDVSVYHGDDGWNHYADRWVVVDAETGEEYGKRVLAHPHVSEQPFTRSLSNVRIPEDVQAVIIKAACNVHGFGGTTLQLDLK